MRIYYYYSGFCHQPSTTKIAGGFRRWLYCVVSKKFFHNRSYSSYCTTLFGTNFFPSNVAVDCAKSKQRCLLLFGVKNYDDDLLIYRNNQRQTTLRRLLFDNKNYRSKVLGGKVFYSTSTTSSSSTPICSFSRQSLLQNNKFVVLTQRSFFNWIPQYNTKILPSDPGNNNSISKKIDGEMEHIENSSEKPVFKPKKVVILTKLTRLEFERRTNPDLNEEELAQSVSTVHTVQQ